ncbi:MAG: hypothetical protein KF797_06405 [Flavobacteriales bacterium]|nr:hypothetical protein [Flavobacteriales bacterium]
MQEPTTVKQQDSFDLILYLWDRRRLILGIMAAGLVAGIIAAYWITPLYKSEVVMFPAITNSVSKALLNEQSTGRDDILALGDEEDCEQLMQMLHSEKIRERVARRFNLMEVYHIDSTGRHRISDLHEAYARHIKYERTRFSSVRVEVLDPDPQRASDMANYIADQVDTVWSEMARERASKGFRLVESRVRELEESIRGMADSMRVLRELGVHDYHTQTERYNEYMGAAIVKGDQRAVKEFEERFKVLAQYGGPYVTLQDRLFNETKRMSVLRMKLEQAQADMESDLPHKFVVNRAQPSDKKHSPVRWLVVAVSMASSVLLAMLVLVVQANIQKIRRTHG